MSIDRDIPTAGDERLHMGATARRLYLVAGAIGFAVLIVAIGGAAAGDNWRRFLHSYLVAFVFFLSIALGGLFFVLLQHLTKAGWSVSVRRIAEALAATLPVLAVLSLPIVISVAMQNGSLYRWARPLESKVGLAPPSEAHATAKDGGASPILHDEAEDGGASSTLRKRAYLNGPFFLIRLGIYFAIWSVFGVWYWRQSVKQDQSGDVGLTSRMEARSAPAMLLFGLTVTFASFDLLMSLDPAWFSTIFGVYFFSGCAVSIFAAIIALSFIMQRSGLLTQSVTTEHYHDLGKFLFGFTFFWGYIAFSQYMLIWYANIPEETAWLVRHGMSTNPFHITTWAPITLALLFGNFLIPFVGLLSRHVKRNRRAVAFWAAWLLLFHYLDTYWLVMPEYGELRPRWLDLATLIGVGGIFTAAFTCALSRHSLRPLRDPRLEEALTFENV